MTPSNPQDLERIRHLERILELERERRLAERAVLLGALKDLRQSCADALLGEKPMTLTSFKAMLDEHIDPTIKSFE